jgi:hypothetical protein
MTADGVLGKSDKMPRARKRPPVRLTVRGLQIVLELRARFEQKFGRAPGPGDPVSFDAEADAVGPADQLRFDAVMIAAMEAAGVGPAIIHAYRRTGIFITEHNVAARSRDELQRWQAALDEYDEEVARSLRGSGWPDSSWFG